MTALKPNAAPDSPIPGLAHSETHRAWPRMLLPTRHRYTGRMPAWAWITLIGLCIAAALPVVRTSSITESGMELRALEAERERLTSEIRSLAAHVGQLGSLSRVQQQAQERMRMVPAQPTVVLELSESPPAPTLPERLLPSAEHSAAEPAQRTQRSVWRTVFELLVFE